MLAAMSDVELNPTRPSETSGQVVVFDFDGTLVSRDSFLDFMVSYCVRRPLRLLFVVALLPLALPLALRSLAPAASLLLWAITVGTSTRSFASAVSRYAKETLPSYANDAIFLELTRHLERGNRVVIATGSLPLLVRGLLRARQLGPIPIVGTRLRRRGCGLTTETHCTGSTKVRELHRKLGIREWWTVYTNSFADRSLLRSARDIILVDPSERTVRCTRRLVGGGAPLRVMRRG